MIVKRKPPKNRRLAGCKEKEETLFNKGYPQKVELSRAIGHSSRVLQAFICEKSAPEYKK